MTDKQHDVFAGAGPGDWDGEHTLIDQAHMPGGPEDLPIGTPEGWNADYWDEGRETPKTVAEAQRALVARLNTPGTPDNISTASAYDGLEHTR